MTADRHTPHCLIGWEVADMQLFVHAPTQLTWIQKQYLSYTLSLLHTHQHTSMQSFSCICSHMTHVPFHVSTHRLICLPHVHSHTVTNLEIHICSHTCTVYTWAPTCTLLHIPRYHLFISHAFTAHHIHSLMLTQCTVLKLCF